MHRNGFLCSWVCKAQHMTGIGETVHNPACTGYRVVVGLICSESGYLSQQVYLHLLIAVHPRTQDTTPHRWVARWAKLQKHGSRSGEDKGGLFPLLILHASCFLITHHKPVPACQSAVHWTASRTVARGEAGSFPPWCLWICWWSKGVWACKEHFGSEPSRLLQTPGSAFVHFFTWFNGVT